MSDCGCCNAREFGDLCGGCPSCLLHASMGLSERCGDEEQILDLAWTVVQRYERLKAFNQPPGESDRITDGMCTLMRGRLNGALTALSEAMLSAKARTSDTEGKTVIILRGVPGSGKSTLAETLRALGAQCVNADAMRESLHDGQYVYDPAENDLVHGMCFDLFVLLVQREHPVIVVDNVNPDPRHFAPYVKMAREAGYLVHVVVVENRHDGESRHGVPRADVARLAQRIGMSTKLGF